MKTRQGFVSNSSTSSFVCDISGTVLAATDDDFYEATCICKDCGAHFLGCYVKVPENLDSFTKEDMIELCKARPNDSIETIREIFLDFVKRAAEGERRTYVNRLLCPVCTMDKIIDGDVLNYLLSKSGMTLEEVEAKMRVEFDKDVKKARASWANSQKP